MNSYRHLKKLFKEDLVFFNKVDKKFTVRVRDSQELIAEFYPIENYPKFMLLNKNPYSLKVSMYKGDFLKYLVIDDKLFKKLNDFIELNKYFNEFIKELLVLKVIDLKLSDIIKNPCINFDINYKNINNITIYISKIVNNFEEGINFEIIDVLYNFKDNKLYIDGVVTDIKDIDKIKLGYKKDFKNNIKEFLDYKINKVKGFIDGY